MELKERERKVDLSKMTPEQVDALSEQLGIKLRTMCDELAMKVNLLLNMYGASAKIAIAFDKLPEVFDKDLSTETSNQENNTANQS